MSGFTVWIHRAVGLADVLVSFEDKKSAHDFAKWYLIGIPGNSCKFSDVWDGEFVNNFFLVGHSPSLFLEVTIHPGTNFHHWGFMNYKTDEGTGWSEVTIRCTQDEALELGYDKSPLWLNSEMISLATPETVYDSPRKSLVF